MSDRDAIILCLGLIAALVFVVAGTAYDVGKLEAKVEHMQHQIETREKEGEYVLIPKNPNN